MADSIIILIVAITIDLLLGEPPNALHPVVWLGRWIGCRGFGRESDPLHFPVCGRQRNTRSEPREDRDRAHRIRSERCPDLVVDWEPEAFRHDAHDGMKGSVELHALSHHLRIRCEPGPPRVESDHHHRRCRNALIFMG